MTSSTDSGSADFGSPPPEPEPDPRGTAGPGIDPDALPGWARPAAPAQGVPRWVRVLTGVTEPVLDRIPTERSRYTALACVMIGTAAIGGVSMFFALSEILGGGRLWFLPLALAWSGFVLCLDRWLVASLAGHRLLPRVFTAALRLLIAVLFGFMIAEPLVLRVFDTAIVAQVQKERAQNISQLQSELAACNPPSGAHPATASGYVCTNLDLAVPAPSAADQSQISSLQNQAGQLQSTINTENAQIESDISKVNNECNGTAGPGLTGRAGNGAACQQDYQAYQNDLGAMPVARQQAQLASLQTQITDLQGTNTADSKSTQTQLKNAIAQRVASQLPAVDSPIGLIERLDALSHLSLGSTVVDFAAWAMRIFFVLIDCLPVLVKFASGVTPYDALAGDLVSSARRISLLELKAREKAAEQRIAVELEELNALTEKRRQNSDFDVRRHTAQIEAQELAAIDEDYERRLAAALLKEEREAAGPETAGPSRPAAPAGHDLINGKTPVNGVKVPHWRPASDLGE